MGGATMILTAVGVPAAGVLGFWFAWSRLERWLAEAVARDEGA